MSEVVLRTIKGFREAYGPGKTKIYELIKAGVLKIKKDGKSTYIIEESARAWADSLPDGKKK